MTTNISQRTLKKMLLGDDVTVTLRFKGASQMVAAKALDVQYDSEGNPTYLCLDRLVHRAFEELISADIPDSRLVSVSVSGCVATEMHLTWLPS
jgi:hypothetical protein